VLSTVSMVHARMRARAAPMDYPRTGVHAETSLALRDDRRVLGELQTSPVIRPVRNDCRTYTKAMTAN
jgi:hypothetical protein